MTTPHHTLESREWISDDIYEIRLSREGLGFVPGDCVALFGADGRISRPYSIASGTADPWLSFLIRRMPGGALSGWLADIAPGTPVTVSKPFGWFRPGDPQVNSPQIFLGTGTGVAPFIAALRSRPDWRPQRLGYGVRVRADAVNVSWLRERCPLTLFVSREAADDARRGRVTELVRELEPDPEAHWYLCGLDTMIDEVTRLLEARGVPIHQIHRECFFNAPPG